MKIGIDVRKIEDYGIGTHIKSIILHAIRRDRDSEYFLFCDPRQVRKEEEHIRWIPESSSKYSVSEHFSLASHADKLQLNLFHSPHYTLPLRMNCRSIVTIHDLIHFKFPDFFPAWKRKAAALVMKKAIHKAELVLTVSETTRQDVASFVPEAKDKIEVLYNRLGNEWNQSPKDINLRSLGIPQEYILYAGNFKKHKSIDTLLDAFKNMYDAPPLILVGNNSSIDDSLLEKIFSSNRVRLLGFADAGLLQRLYSETMLFVFPSLYEGFGYPPLEAMACGAPVLSSDAPALKEILADAAEYFSRGSVEELKEKLTSLLQSATRRRELSEKGRARAKTFMNEDSPSRLLEMYRRFKSI